MRRYSLQEIFSLFIVSISLSLFLQINNAFAGWSENVRLTYRGFEISPQVIARNDTVHVVWFQMVSNNIGHVSYIRSTDGGQSWGSIINLNASGHNGSYSNLNLAERGLLVSWFDNDTLQDITSIGIRKSINGATWSAPSYVWTDNPNHFGNPVSAVKGDSIFLVYYSNRNDSTGLLPIRSMHSYNYGQTWSDEVTVGHPITTEQRIVLNYCGGILLAASACVPDSSHFGQLYIIGYRSTDAGRTWSDTIWISPYILYVAQNLCLSCNKATYQFIAGYMHDRYSIYAFHGDIFATISYDGGITWPNEYQATNNHTAWWPSVDYIGDTIVTCWSDMRYYSERWHEIVFNRSNNGGLSWQGEQRITNTPDESYDPWISFDNGKIHVAWREEVGGQESEIFYKNYTPDSTDAIEEPGLSSPSNFCLSAYPNPFNSTVAITISSNEPGILDIYDIQGRIVRQYPFEKGNQKIVWDAKATNSQPLTSGIYFIGRKGEVKNTIKVVYMK